MLSRRSLNRSLLARQFLLERVARSVPEVIEQLVGMQAQEPRDPYVALWSRIDAFEAAALSDLLVDRRVVRGPLLRATIHLVTDRDALSMRPILGPVLERTFSSGSPFGRSLAEAGVDPRAVAAAGRELLGERPRTRAELRTLLGPMFPAADAAALAQAVTYLVPAVQVPPRGLWGRSGQATWAPLESWLGQPMAGDASPDGLVLRYLAAFGPATAADIRAWSGLAGAAEILDRLRRRLRTFRDDADRELFDIPDAPMPEPDTPAPVRFLPVYDNVLLAHADRSRIFSDEDRRRVLQLDRGNVGSVLVDGFARALWRAEADGERATLHVAVLHPLSPAEDAAVTAEGDRLLAFLAPAAGERRVVVRPLPGG